MFYLWNCLGKKTIFLFDMNVPVVRKLDTFLILAFCVYLKMIGDVYFPSEIVGAFCDLFLDSAVFMT